MSECATCHGWGEVLDDDGINPVVACPTCSPDAYEELPND